MRKPEIPYFYLSPAILVLCLFVATVAHAGEGGGRRQAWVEPGVDRPGSDFKILWLRGGPGAGPEAGSQKPPCQSFTYVQEGNAGGQTRNSNRNNPRDRFGEAGRRGDELHRRASQGCRSGTDRSSRHPFPCRGRRGRQERGGGIGRRVRAARDNPAGMLRALC